MSFWSTQYIFVVDDDRIRERDGVVLIRTHGNESIWYHDESEDNLIQQLGPTSCQALLGSSNGIWRSSANVAPILSIRLGN